MRFSPALFLAFALVAPRLPAMHWSETFEALPLGTITSNPGWGELMGEGTLAACSVSEANPFSGLHALMVGTVPSIGATRKLAVYSGASYTYTGLNDEMLRVSARIYRTNNAQYFSLVLGTGETAAITLGTTLTGRVRVNGIDTGVAWVTGRYAEAVLWYNLLTDQVTVQYDGAVILPWTALGAGMTGFNRIWVQRTKIGASDSGAILVDDLGVESLNPNVWGWWRCDDTTGGLVSEHTGHFAPAALIAPPAQPNQPGVWKTVQSGTDELANLGAISGMRASPVPATAAMPATRDWTLELVFLYDPSFPGNMHLFRLLSTSPGATSEISVVTPLTGGISVSLRDRDAADSTLVTAVPSVVAPTGRWHHLAIVKSNANLLTYIDYSPVGNVAIGANGDGSFEFPLPALASLGATGSVQLPDGVFVDEVRFTREVLGPNTFLRAARPEIVDMKEFGINDDGLLRLQFRVAGSPGRIYMVEGSSDFVNWAFFYRLEATRLIGWTDTTFSTPHDYRYLIVRDIGPLNP